MRRAPEAYLRVHMRHAFGAANTQPSAHASSCAHSAPPALTNTADWVVHRGAGAIGRLAGTLAAAGRGGAVGLGAAVVAVGHVVCSTSEGGVVQSVRWRRQAVSGGGRLFGGVQQTAACGPTLTTMDVRSNGAAAAAAACHSPQGGRSPTPQTGFQLVGQGFAASQGHSPWQATVAPREPATLHTVRKRVGVFRCSPACQLACPICQLPASRCLQVRTGNLRAAAPTSPAAPGVAKDLSLCGAHWLVDGWAAPPDLRDDVGGRRERTAALQAAALRGRQRVRQLRYWLVCTS